MHGTVQPEPPDPAGTSRAPGVSDAPEHPGNGSAIASLVCGVIAVLLSVTLFLPFVGIINLTPSILGVVFGHMGTRRAAATRQGKVAAIVGTVLSYLMLGVTLLMTAFWLYVLGTMLTEGEQRVVD